MQTNKRLQTTGLHILMSKNCKQKILLYFTFLLLDKTIYYIHTCSDSCKGKRNQEKPFKHGILFVTIKMTICRIRLQQLYSLVPKLWTKCCFMKQNCHLERDVAQYKDAATSLNFIYSKATFQGFPNRYIALF